MVITIRTMFYRLALSEKPESSPCKRFCRSQFLLNMASYLLIFIVPILICFVRKFNWLLNVIKPCIFSLNLFIFFVKIYRQNFQAEGLKQNFNLFQPSEWSHCRSIIKLTKKRLLGSRCKVRTINAISQLSFYKNINSLLWDLPKVAKAMQIFQINSFCKLL